LVNAIERRYSHKSDKLDDFLNDIKEKMNDNYPLNTYKSQKNTFTDSLQALQIY
jgi:hypothetical protein